MSLKTRVRADVNYDAAADQAGSAAAVSKITSDAASVNATIKALGLGKQLPIGTSDAGSELTETLAAGIDYFHANVHPWFADGVTITDAATWTWSFFQEFDVDVAATAPNKPETAIAETGWPTREWRLARQGRCPLADPHIAQNRSTQPTRTRPALRALSASRPSPICRHSWTRSSARPIRMGPCVNIASCFLPCLQADAVGFLGILFL